MSNPSIYSEKVFGSLARIRGTGDRKNGPQFLSPFEEILAKSRLRKEIEEQQQTEVNELKVELEQLKKTHEKTVSQLAVADDVAQRDQTLERKLVQLAEAMLLVKQDNEASFKDLKRRVKKIGGASESEQSSDELLKVKEELEAKVEELQKSLDRKEAELVQQSDESKLALGKVEQQLMERKEELEKNIQAVKSTVAKLKEQEQNVAKMKADLQRKEKEIEMREQDYKILSFILIFLVVWFVGFLYFC